MKLLKALVMALAAVAMTFTAQAEKTAKVVLADYGKTLRFVYDETNYGTKGTDWFSVAEAEAISPDGTPPWYGKRETVNKVVFDESFVDYRPTQCYRWFYEFKQLVTIENIENLDTSAVTDMAYMFYLCLKLKTLDLSGFDTSAVTDMCGMFELCSSLTQLNLSGFDTAKVTDMAYMFYGCSLLTTLDVSGFDTSAVTDMCGMFYDCSSLTTLDVSGFDTANVTDMECMFYECSSLEAICASDRFVTDQVSYSYSMFQGCSKLVGGAGTAYDSTKIIKTYARIDGKDGLPGYFTQGQMTIATGAYASLDLVKDLGIEIPDVDYAIGDKVTVKVEGLAKGLKLVTTQLKETTGKKAVTNVVYTIEGVPTEEIDFETRPMYARVTVTYKDKTMGVKGKVESLQPIELSVVTPEPSVLTAGVLNAVYEPVDIAALWPDVADAKTNPKDWSFKGWPAGIKYTTKDVTTKNKDKSVTTNAPAYSVYGQPTKAGEFPITATHKHKIDGKSVSETFSAILTVWGDDGATDFRYEDQAYVATATKTLDATWKSFSGLPAGIKYTTKQVAADTKKGTPEYPAYSLYGTPTKAGVFAVTATKVDPNDSKKTVKETFLWKVTEGENPGLGATDIDWSNSWIKYDADATHTVRMPQGLSVDLPVSASALASGAKVTVSGLPSGLKYDAKTGRITGVATKAESKVVTVKVVQNGVTVTTTFAIRVDANPFAGTYYGFFLKEAERHVATAVITPAAGGTAKLVFDEYVPSLEKTVKYTATAKGFTMNGWYTLVDWFNPGGMENDCVSVIYDFTLKADAKNNPDFAAGERTMRVCLAWTESEGFGSTKGSGIELTKARSPVAAKLAGGARLQMTGTTRIYGQIVKALNAADYGKILDLGLPAPTPILTGTCTNETGHVLYYSAAFDAKKVQYQVAGKLADGTTVKTLLPLALAEWGWTTAAFLLQEKKGARRTFAGLFEMDRFGCWTAEALNVSKCSAFDALPATAAEQLGGERELGCESELVLDAAELTASGFEGEAPAFRFVVNGTSWAKAKLDIYAPGAEEGAKPLASLASAKLQASTGYVFKGSFKWDAKVGGDGNTYSFELVPSAADGKTFVGRCEVKPAKGAAITVSGFMRDYEQPSGLGGVQLWENGPYWAECNVGATKPEEYGYCFWWGDTVGYKRNASNDAWESVKTGASFTFSSDNCPTYDMTTEQLQSDGYIDSTDNLAAEYDAATVHLGAPWRMPTDAEMSALISNCTTVWTNNWNDTGVNGRLVTGKGAYASKSIFLPAAGYGYDSDFDSPGSGGGFWSSTPNSDYSDYAWSLGFYSGYFSRSSNYRYRGRSVRPVRGFAK